MSFGKIVGISCIAISFLAFLPLFALFHFGGIILAALPLCLGIAFCRTDIGGSLSLPGRANPVVVTTQTTTVAPVVRQPILHTNIVSRVTHSVPPARGIFSGIFGGPCVDKAKHRAATYAACASGFPQPISTVLPPREEPPARGIFSGIFGGPCVDKAKHRAAKYAACQKAAHHPKPSGWVGPRR